MSTFRADIDKFMGATEESLSKALRRTALRIHRDVIRASPVDTGRFRASWIASVDTPSDKVAAEGEHSAPAENIEGTVEHDSTIFIVNNVDYATRLEQGTSKQAPAGIIYPLEPRMRKIWEEEMEAAL